MGRLSLFGLSDLLSVLHFCILHMDAVASLSLSNSLTINLSASHERTWGVISTTQCGQETQGQSLGLMSCYWSALCGHKYLFAQRY